MKKGKVKWAIGLGLTCICLGMGLIAITLKPSPLQDNYRNYYEIFVYSFCDSNGDGIGDLDGITQKLDYIQNLGIDGIWLTPIMPSQDYHKYSVMDYKAIDPQFGTMEDFEELIAEANKRGIKVIIDLVLNHSSDQNPWFISAKESLIAQKPNEFAAYYQFGRGEKPAEEGYYSLGVEDYYYEAVFSEHMPDLNMANESLREEVKSIANFWIDKGVAGFRLDAAKYIFQEEKQTIAFWKWFSDYCKTIKPDIYMVGEVWGSGGEIESYYESGIDSYFNFPFAGANGNVVTTVQQKRGADFVKGIAKWQNRMHSVAPEAIDAVFLSNHDQDRSAGMLGKKLENQKMAASLYLTMPGNVFVYYGEEIGMLGESPDPDRRAPMVWSVVDQSGMPQPPPGTAKLVPIEAGALEQLTDKNSLLHFYKKALTLRKENPELARGVVMPIDLGDKNLGAYSVTYDNSQVIVIHNLGTEAKTFSFPKQGYHYKKVRGSLVAGEGKVTLEKDQLHLPPQSTVILK